MPKNSKPKIINQRKNKTRMRTKRNIRERHVNIKKVNPGTSTQASLCSSGVLIPTTVNDHLEDYAHPYNKIILSNYGGNILKYYNEMESNQLITFNDYIEENSPINPNDHRRLLYSLDQVIEHYKLANETYFLSSYIIDAYLNKLHSTNTSTITCPILSTKDIKLIGLTSFYIGSKMTDILPLRVNEISSIVGQKEFAPNEIIEKEIDIMNMIDFNLDILSTYDIIQIMLCDCTTSSNEQIEAFHMQNEMKNLKEITILLAKVIEGNKKMMKIRLTLKAIGCIIVAFDILRSDDDTKGFLSNDAICFMQSWLMILVKRNGYANEVIHPIYNMIKDDYMKEIMHNTDEERVYFFKKDNN